MPLTKFFAAEKKLFWAFENKFNPCIAEFRFQHLSFLRSSSTCFFIIFFQFHLSANAHSMKIALWFQWLCLSEAGDGAVSLPSFFSLLIWGTAITSINPRIAICFWNCRSSVDVAWMPSLVAAQRGTNEAQNHETCNALLPFEDPCFPIFKASSILYVNCQLYSRLRPRQKF